MRTWGAWKASTGTPEEHIPTAELYEFLIHPTENPDRENLLDHLTQCPLCLHELDELVENMEETENRIVYMDFALPKAAASPLEGPRQITTERGKYTIEIRQHISGENKGIIIVQVAAPYREDLEGKNIVLRDSRGRILLRSMIINGEASQEIEALDQIEYGLVIQAE